MEATQIARKQQEGTAETAPPIPETSQPETAGMQAGMPLFMQRLAVGGSPPPQVSQSSSANHIHIQRQTLTDTGNKREEEEEEDGLVQTKLMVNQPGDVYEQEADQIAEIAMRQTGQPNSTIGESKDTPLVQRASIEQTGFPNTGSIESSSTGLPASGGSPIPETVRQQIEPALGTDLSYVKVHQDSNAANAASNLQAKAFTHQNHIWLAADQSPQDTGLIAHEATHVVQQTSGAAPVQLLQRQPETAALTPTDPQKETELESSEPEAADTEETLYTEGETDETETAEVDEELEETKAGEEDAETEEEEEETAEEEGEETEGEEEEGESGEESSVEGGKSMEGESSGEEGGAPGEGEAGAGSPDLALIDEELAEHERWAGSFGEMGTAGSDQRARFLLDQAGQGAVSGAEGGVAMGFVMGVIGAGIGQIAGRRLATLAVSRGFAATPVPGLGSAIGGVMAVAGLAMRDWGATAETISRFGEGEGYEGLANDLEAAAEALDVATQVMDVLAGVLGGIAVGMWVGAVLSAGALSPLATTLSAIALGINAATTAIGIIISVVIRPTVTALRALHTFQSQGDPTQIEAEGQQLQAAAGQITGAVAGAAAGRVGGRVGARGGTRADRAISGLQARRTGGAPAMSARAGQGPRIHVEVPEAPTRPVGDAGPSPTRPVTEGGGSATTARPASAEGPAAASPAGPARPEESFADLGDVVAELNASPEVAARLQDTRAPLQQRATPWSRRGARRYGNVQARQHRQQTGMAGSEVQAGHTAAARHARESGISEADWDRQQWMDLHSRRGQGLDVTVTDQSGRTSTRTRHTSQELIIDAAVERSRQTTGGQLTPQGQLDAADYVAWVTENTPYRQQDVESVLSSSPARPESGPPVDPTTGRVIPQAPSASSPVPRSGGDTPTSGYTSHTETMRTPDRSAAMAQYHSQIGADPGRESGVWRDADGNYYVMQGDQGSVAPPSASSPLELIYHSHPTESGTARQGMVSQPSQAGGDFGVLQYQHGQGPAGRRQSSELHFPTYDDSGAHTGYGTTRFAYDPTNPLPLQVETTLPGGRPSRQRYASFADFEQRTGIQAGGATPADSAATRSAADVQLSQDVASAQQRISTITEGTRTSAYGLPGMREGSEFGRQVVQDETAASEGPARGPAYTAAVTGPGLEPGETVEIPINPAYPEPPGTTAELDALREQVSVSRDTQRELRATEQSMNTQADQQRTHNTELGEAQGVTTDLAAGRTSHQSAVDSTDETNTQQQSTSEDAVSNLGRGAQEATALATLVGSLRAFQGLAHLFSYLPGDLGRDAENAKNDAGELINTLNRVAETETTKGQIEGGQGELEANEEKIGTVASEGEQTDEELASGEQSLVELEQANAASLAETEAVEQQASQERSQAASSEQEAQSTHDDLESRLQSWAVEHRQAREDAVQEAISRYTEMGYEATED